MSKNWQSGSTTAWRRLRGFVLARDGWVCQIPGHPETPAHLRDQLRDACTSGATQVHHLDGTGLGIIVSPDRLASSCRNCNLTLGDVTRFSPGQGGPTPVFPVSSLSPEPRSELAWSPDRLAAYDWLEPYLEAPEDAAPPLFMSPPPDDAVGSYGADAIEWIEREQRIRLRWWQKLAIVRQLERREDGSLCHRTVLESCPRRAGKSVRIRGMALWRLAHPEVFGSPEAQTVVHTGSDLAIVREIQRGAWRWAEDDAGWTVVRANGKEQLETPTGDRWLARAQTAVYGYNVDFGLIDEAWDVKPEVVSEGLEPAMLERQSPQLHITSTAHRRARSTMKTLLKAALTMEDPGTLLLVWAAPFGSDPGDEAVWRSASPYWSEDRLRMITDKYARALAGESDPTADDPDPMAGFSAQYLNIWRLDAAKTDRGDAPVAPDVWAGLVSEAPEAAPDSAAIESWFGAGISVSMAWRLTDGRVVVRSVDVDDLSQAADTIRASGMKRRHTLVGESLLDDPALKGLLLRKASGRAAASVLELARLIGEGAFLHDGGELLTNQVLAARTMPGADGPRMVSTGRFDSVKTAVWAANAARKRTRVGAPRIVSSSA